MSSQLPVPPLNDNDVPDDDVYVNDQYVEIPDWHRELLNESLARYREVGMEGTPWEEIEKELDEIIEEESRKRNKA